MKIEAVRATIFDQYCAIWKLMALKILCSKWKQPFKKQMCLFLLDEKLKTGAEMLCANIAKKHVMNFEDFHQKKLRMGDVASSQNLLTNKRS